MMLVIMHYIRRRTFGYIQKLVGLMTRTEYKLYVLNTRKKKKKKRGGAEKKSAPVISLATPVLGFFFHSEKTFCYCFLQDGNIKCWARRRDFDNDGAEQNHRVGDGASRFGAGDEDVGLALDGGWDGREDSDADGAGGHGNRV